MTLPRLAQAKRLKWDLQEHGLTQGSIGVFLQCPEQFRILYCEGWEMREPSFAIEFGNYWHMACELDDPDQAAFNWRKASKAPGVLEPARREAEEGAALIPPLWRVWQDWFKKRNAKMKWECKEKAFRLDYLFQSTHWMWSPRIVPLRGKFDGLFWRDGKLWLHEIKTKAIVDKEVIDTSLMFNLQTMLYLSAIKLLYPKEYAKGKVGGVVYDVIRRPGMRQGVNETTEDYAARCIADVKGEQYTQLTGKKKRGQGPEHYFTRWVHDLKEGELETWQGRVLEPILARLLQWNDARDDANPWNNPHHYMNPNALVGQWGPCAAYGAITDRNYCDLKPRKFMYPELEAAA